MIVAPPVCVHCRHYRFNQPVTCAAFPDRIPDLIWLEGNTHTTPIPGDQGIQFERNPTPPEDRPDFRE